MDDVTELRIIFYIVALFQVEIYTNVIAV